MDASRTQVVAGRGATRLVGDHGWGPLVVAAAIFFAMGFVTWLNGPLISFVRVAFSLDDFSAFFIPLVFYASYLVFSIPASVVARRLGLKRGLAASILLSALGVATFGQFIAWRIYGGALAGLLMLGAGLSLMQVVINPLVSLLGPATHASKRIAIMGICNKFAGMLAPIALAFLVMRDIGTVAQRAAAADPATRDALLAQFVHAIYWPYLGMAAMLVVLAGIVALSPLPHLEAPPLTGTADHAARRLLRPHLVLGVVAMFLYVGVEVMAGDAIGTYGQAFGLPLDETKFFTAFTLGAMLVGYIAGFLIVPRLISQERYLVFSCALGMVLTCLAFLTTGFTSVMCIASLGVANAMIMPTIFPIAIRGAGPATPLASAFLVMAYSGGAVIPQIYVLLKPFFGFQGMFALLVLPSYLAVLLYARRYGRIGMD